MKPPKQPLKKRVKEDEEDERVEGKEMLPDETAEPNEKERKPVKMRKGGLAQIKGWGKARKG